MLAGEISGNFGRGKSARWEGAITVQSKYERVPVLDYNYLVGEHHPRSNDSYEPSLCKNMRLQNGLIGAGD